MFFMVGLTKDEFISILLKKDFDQGELDWNAFTTVIQLIEIWPKVLPA